MEKQNILVGKTIKVIKLAEDKKAILFETDEGDHMARADGDCCSETWIEHVQLPAMGFPALVSAVEDIDLPLPPLTEAEAQEEEDGEIQFYGCKISTDRGDIVIDYRNLSNGYYGGSLAWPEDYFYGGVHGQNVSSEKWVELLTDI